MLRKYLQEDKLQVQEQVEMKKFRVVTLYSVLSSYLKNRPIKIL